LNKVKQVVIDAGKKVLIQIQGEIVRIITDFTAGDSGDAAVYGFSDIWEKVKVAAKKVSAKIKVDVLKVIEEYKPKVLDDLKRLQATIIEGGKKILITIKNDVVEVIVGEFVASSEDETYMAKRGFRDVWEKVKAAAKKLGDDIRGRVETAINELKPQILDSLNKVKQVVIDAGKKVLIQIQGEIVRIITDFTAGDSGDAAVYGFSDIWEKVKVAAKKVSAKIKVDVLKVIEEYKPKILDDLKRLQATIVEGGKKILITIKNDVVEVIVGEFIASSEDETYMAKRGFNDLWEKVKAAAEDLDDKIKAKVQEAIEKYKPRIIKGLETVKQVVIDAGKKIVITIRDEIVDIIAGDDAELVESDPEMGYGFKDKMKGIWEKVKGAAKKLGSKTKEIVLKIVEENRPFIMEQLKKIKEALINAGKKVLIQITDDIVKIIVGDNHGSSAGALLYRRGIMDVWNQVKDAVKSATSKVQDYLKNKMDVLKPKIMDALENAKADLNGFKEVVVDGAKRLYVKATAKGVEIIADLKGVWAKVEEFATGADEYIKTKIEEYKPQIIEALNNFQEDVEDYRDFIIEEGNKIIVRINKFGVQIVEDANDVWDKVESALKDFKSDADAFIKAEVEKYKPQIIAALNKFRDDVEDYKDFVIDEAEKIYVRIDNFRVQIMEDANDVYEKARAAAEKLQGDVRDYVIAKIEEYKPKIIEGLNKAKTVVIDGASKIYLEIKGKIVRIITGATSAVSDSMTYGIKDKLRGIWEKVQDAAKKLAGNVKTIVMNIIEENKGKVLEQLNRMKEVLIQSGKQVIIRIVNDVAEIIVGDNVVASDETMLYKRGIRDIWAQVKAAVEKSNAKIRDFFKDKLDALKPKIMEALEKSKDQFNKFKEIVVDGSQKIWVRMEEAGVKIIADFKGVWAKVQVAIDNLNKKTDAWVKAKIEEYKPQIIEALNNFRDDVEDYKDFIIEEAKKIYVRVNKFGVQIVEDANDVMEKVQNAVEKLQGDAKDYVDKLVEEYKPKVIEALNNAKSVVLDGGKKVLIQIRDQVVQIITDFIEGSSGAEAYGIKDLWTKVKEAAKKLGGEIKQTVLDVIEENKPLIIAELNQLKETIIKAVKKIIIQVDGEIIKIIVGEDFVESEAYQITKRGFSDFWEKVKNAVKETTGQVKDFLQDKLDVLKPKILAALEKAKADVNGFKEVVIEGSKRIFVRAKAKGVEIIADLKGVWAKVEAALNEAQDKASEFIKAKIEEYKPQIIEALNKFQDDVEDYKDFIIEEAKKIHVRIDKFRVQIVEDANDVMDKVQNAVDKLQGDLKDYVQAKVDELKPLVIEKLNDAKHIVIEGATKIYIEIKDQIARIITGVTSAVSGSEAYGIKDKLKAAWEKVKDAAKNLGGKIKTIVLEIIEENKPLIMEQLNKMKEALIKAGKTVLIRIVNDVAEIIVGDNSVESDDEFTYMEKRGIKDAWRKFKEAIQRSNAKIRDFFKDKYDALKPKIAAALDKAKADLNKFKEIIVEGSQKIWVKMTERGVEVVADFNKVWDKVKAASDNLVGVAKEQVQALIEKYKPEIIEGLNTVKQVILDSGKKIVITIRDEIVSIITGAEVAESEENAYGIKDDMKDLWAKVKKVAKALPGLTKVITTRILNEHKEEIMAELEKMKQVLIDAGKKVLIVVKKGVVQVVVGSMVGYSDDHALVEKRGFRDFWEKVKAAVAKSNANIRDFFKSNWDKIAPKIKEAFEKVKAGSDKFVEVVTEKGELIIVKIKEGAQQVIVDFKNAWAKVQEAFEKLDAHIQAKIEEFKPQIIEALNKFQEDVEDYKDFIIEEGNKIIVRINKAGVQIVEDANNVLDKVNAAADKLSDDVRDYVKAKVEELKPLIVAELNKGKQIIVDAANGVIIQIRDEIVRIITGAEEGTSDDVATYGKFDDLWEKIVSTAKSLSPDVLKIVKEAGPKLVESLKKLGVIAIKAGKEIIIELKGEIIRIIDAEEIVESSDEYMMEKRGIKDIWAKVKDAADKLKDSAKEKIQAAIDRLKPQILDALKNVKEVAIDAGKKIIIQIKGEIVRIITGATEATSDDVAYMEKRGVADIWGKVKEAMKKLGDNIKADTKDVIEKLKPKITDALENLKTIVIDAAKKIVIQINDEIVKIVVGDQTAESS